MNRIATKAGQTTRHFEHCGHLMMLVKLPSLTTGSSTRNQTGWRCTVCDTVVDLSTPGGRNGWLNNATMPRQIQSLSMGLPPRR
jgi:hypothetical protein